MDVLASVDLETQISELAIRTVGISAVALVVFILIAVIVNKAPEKVQKYFKLPLFIGIAGVMAGSTLILAISTVYLNVKSESGGPVHWHAGIEFWACGTEFNLRDPQGALSNKVGTATYHEHNDKFIHLEGVVVKKSVDASLDKFMRVTGGYITPTSVGIPLSEDEAAWPITGDQRDGDVDNTDQLAQVTGNGERIGQSVDGNGPVLQLQNGDQCPDGTEGEVQVYAYRFNKDDNTYTQEKLEDPGSYIMRDESSLGPPSDCVIVEFGPRAAATDKICEQYGIKDVERCTDFGVKTYNDELCYIREINRPEEAQDEELPVSDETSSETCLYDPENPTDCGSDTPETSLNQDSSCLAEEEADCDDTVTEPAQLEAPE